MNLSKEGELGLELWWNKHKNDEPIASVSDVFLKPVTVESLKDTFNQINKRVYNEIINDIKRGVSNANN